MEVRIKGTSEEIAGFFASFGGSVTFSTREPGKLPEIPTSLVQPEVRNDAEKLPRWAERLRPKGELPVDVVTVAEEAQLTNEEIAELDAALRTPDIAALVADPEGLYR